MLSRVYVKRNPNPLLIVNARHVIIFTLERNCIPSFPAFSYIPSLRFLLDSMSLYPSVSHKYLPFFGSLCENITDTPKNIIIFLIISFLLLTADGLLHTTMYLSNNPLPLHSSIVDFLLPAMLDSSL